MPNLIYYSVDNISNYLAYTEGVIYDNQCSCALNANCTSDAIFIDKENSSKTISIPGLKIGCTPTESFFASTLECFYNASCVTLIQQQISSNSIFNLTDAPVLISTNSTRFLSNTTITDLVKELFIETWPVTTNYSIYFDLCAPKLCSDTYIQRIDSLYTITLLLSLLSALNFILKWLCPKIVYFFDRIYQYRKNRLIHIHSHSTQTNTGFRLALERFLFLNLLKIILVIIVLIGPLIYLNKQENQHNTQADNILFSTTTTTTTTTTTILTDIIINSTGMTHRIAF